MILKTLTFCLIALTAWMTQRTDPFLGVWENENKTIRMEIYYEEKTYHGRLVPPVNMEQEVFYPRKTILIEMKRKGNILFGGTFFDSTREEEYEARARLLNDSLLVMKVYRGFFGKRDKWHKRH